MRRLALVLLALFAPIATAAPFEGTLEDRRDDVVSQDFRPFDAPSVDILGFTSRFVEGTRVEQRVTMAAPPSLEENSLIVRSWFRNSTNGSFHVLDLEIRSHAEGRETFVAHTRRGAFENSTRVDATWELEGHDWVFTFDAAEVAPDAECFLPMIYSYLSGPPGSGASDQIGMGGRPCATAAEPARSDGEQPFPRVVAGAPEDDDARDVRPTVEPPGTRTPAPGASVALVLAALGVALLARRRR